MRTLARTLVFLAATLAVLTVSPAGSRLAAQDTDSPGSQIRLRIDIFDLPAAEALKVQQEVSLEPDQTATLARIEKMVAEKTAAYVTSCPLVSRPGSRAKYEDTVKVQVVEDYAWNEEAKQLVPVFAQRSAGTIFEVDPTIAGDGEKLELNFALEHHTGDPETETISVAMGGEGASKEVTVTHFHMKKITTRILIKPGTAALVAAFEITGETGASPGETIPDAKRLVFLSADVENDKD